MVEFAVDAGTNGRDEEPTKLPKRLAGRYAYQRELGRGATGRVLLAHDTLDGVQRAIKVVSGPEGERLRWEHERLAQLAHPNIARVFELLRVPERLPAPWSLSAGASALVEQYVDGATAERAAPGLADPEARLRWVVTLGAVIARALGAVHGVGLVHGDVKPANIVVPDSAERACLIDLGLCRSAGFSETVSGTIGYLAPEALLGERSVATDLYAFGVTLYTLLRGDLGPDSERSGPRRAELALSAALVSRPRADELSEAVPVSLRRLVGDLLAAAPAGRPESAREVAMRLTAIAQGLGLSVPPDAAVSTRPLPEEQAARANVRPLVGRDAMKRQLHDHLDAGGIVAVAGPVGSGRSRLIREAARLVQAARAGRIGQAPTYATSARAGPPAMSHDALVHLDGPRVDWAACRRALRAARLQRLHLAIVVEMTGSDEVPPDVPSVGLGPIDAGALRDLLASLLDVDPSPPLLEAARVASGGLPGRLCRLVARGREAGLDPSRPATLRELGRRALSDADVPEEALPLAELLAVAGGALGARAASQVLPDASAMARALRSAGIAMLDGEGQLTLRADARGRLSLSAERRTQLARALWQAELGPLARAHVQIALGREDAAERLIEQCLQEARDAGDPERAAAIGLEGIEALMSPSLSLRLGTADALRARAREATALEILRGVDDPAARAMRAELFRLTGDTVSAESEAIAADTPEAWVVRGRLALVRGDFAGAEQLSARVADRAGGPSGELDPATLARAYEVDVFVALSRADTAAASRAARESARAAARTEDRGALARAASVEGSVLQSRGLIQEAAACYERAFELADGVGERYIAASCLVNVGLGRLERGALGAAVEALREGARRLTSLGRRRDATRALYNLGNAAALIGDDDLAQVAIGQALEGARLEGDLPAAGLSAVVAAELSVRAGKLEVAAAALEEAWHEAAGSTRVVIGARRAHTAAIRGDLKLAQEILRSIQALPTDGVGAVERAVAGARVAIAGGALSEAASHALEAVAQAQGAGFESQLRAALCASEALERAGRSEESAASLAHARGLLDAAASTLSSPARARLRAVSAYQRALRATPSAPQRSRRADAPRYRRLVRHSKRLVGESSMPRLYDGIVDAAVDLAHAERGFLVRRAPDGALRVLSARGFAGDLSTGRPSASVVNRVLDVGRALVAVDALEDDRLHAADSVHAMALRSVLAVPVPLGTTRSTALVLDDRLRPAAFDREVVEVISDLVEIAAGAIQRTDALRTQRRAARKLAREKRQLSQRVESAEHELSALRGASRSSAFDGIVADSDPMRRALHLVTRVSASDAPVLVVGESGTGKELVARAVHDASPRRSAAYVSENCSAIPEALLESTLFGHVRGAFTGAERARRGLFEVADGGTLFLDEIGEMSDAMQAKLLRVLQNGELRPIGSERTRKVDVRLVAATHRDLDALVEQGSFRQDLFYRIAVLRVELPPLRDRPADLPALVAAFLERHAPGRQVQVDSAAMQAFRHYRWPGNVRELENEIRRALVLADRTITPAHLSPAVRGDEEPVTLDELDLKGRVAALEGRLIRRALERTGGNRTRAATLLGLSRYGLQKMMKRLAVVWPPGQI